MRTPEHITDDGNDFLAYRLPDLIAALGEAERDSAWLCTGVEAYGPAAKELHRYSNQGQILTSQELSRLAAGVEGIADGYFYACRPAETQPWLKVRVIDDGVYLLETHDWPAVQHIKAQRKKPTPHPQPAPPEPPSKRPPPQSHWDQAAFAQDMRKRTSPVSAFFLLDSVEAFERCTQWLALLQTYDVPAAEHSAYFEEVRQIYRARQQVVNFDHDFHLHWQNQELPGRLRCHFVDKGRYEIELWLPGVIANELDGHFTDGHTGFFCAFMPPLFYD